MYTPTRPFTATSSGGTVGVGGRGPRPAVCGGDNGRLFVMKE